MNLKQIDGLILDADGVLFNGHEEIGDLKKTFQVIRDINLSVIIASNSSTRTQSYYVERLASYGVRIGQDQIITSAVIAVNYLRQMFPQSGAVYVIGEKALIETISDAGFYTTDESEALAVVVGLDRRLTYEKLKKASLHIRNGASFIATNADGTVRTPEGLVPAAGAIVAALETTTGVAARVMGKPQTAMYNLALGALGLKPHQVLAIGDQLAIDIACAQALGCPAALVLSGVDSRETAQDWLPAVDVIADNLSDVVAGIARVKRDL
jgi:4-nitrophenyl phosphatase